MKTEPKLLSYLPIILTWKGYTNNLISLRRSSKRLGVIWKMLCRLRATRYEDIAKLIYQEVFIFESFIFNTFFYDQEYPAYGSTENTSEKPPHCDGHDEMGCYQVCYYYI